MNLHKVVNEYFKSWKIAGHTTYGTKGGYIKLCDGETAIKIFFNLNGGKYWTDPCVTIDHIKGCDGLCF